MKATDTLFNIEYGNIGYRHKRESENGENPAACGVVIVSPIALNFSMAIRSIVNTSPDMDTPAARVFDKAIWRNTGVCNGCFNLIKDVDSYEIGHSITYNEYVRTDSSLHHDDESHSTVESSIGKIDGDIRSWQPRTTCHRCSRVGCWADSHTLSLAAAERLARSIVDRLDELDIPHDPALLIQLVRELKSDDSLQGDDTGIFRAATKWSVLAGTNGRQNTIQRAKRGIGR